MVLVKPVVPWPPDQGTRVVSAFVLDAVREHFDVTILARRVEPRDDDAVDELRARGFRVVTVDAPRRRGVWARASARLANTARAVATRASMRRLYDCPGALVRQARRLAREPYDLVLLEYWQLHPLLDVFEHDRTVLLTHDIDWDVNRRAALLERRLVAKLRAVRRWRVERGEEIAAYRRARRVLALTERDARAVSAVRGTRDGVHVLPFGIDPGGDPPRSGRRREVLFLGTMSAGFNRDALEFFVREIHPHLEGERIDVRIVGGALPESIAAFGGRDDVHVVGRVDDVREALERAGCIVVPLRYGGGLRIRILEALAAGTPVVATPVAVAGMDLEDGVHLRCSDDPREIARAIRHVLDDPDEAAAMAARGRRRLLETHEAGACAKALREMLQSFVKQ